MAAHTELTVGTRVKTPLGYTGVVSKAPALTPTGYVVSVKYDAEFAHLSAAGGADYTVDGLTVIEAAPAAPAATGRALRPSQGESAVGGMWELLYDKPKLGVQIVRDRGVYALVCVAHLTVHRLERLADEGKVRRAGGWCPDCQG